MPSTAIRASFALVWLLSATDAVAVPVHVPSPSSLPTSVPAPSARDDRNLLVILQGDPSSEGALEGVLDALSGAKRFHLRRLETLLPLMRRIDASRDVAGALSRANHKARQAMLALDWAQAATQLDHALAACRDSFLSLYDPSRVANLHVVRGTVALQRAQPERASQHFKAALHLAPALKLDAYHSPQVRAAVADTRRNLAARPLPRAELMQRILRVEGAPARALVVAAEAKAGGRLLLKAMLFSRRGAELKPLDAITTPTDATTQKSRIARFGSGLRKQIASLYPALPRVPSTQATSLPETRPVPPPPPPPRPWYKRWYVWALVGAVVTATAVTVPYLARERVVDMNVTW